MSSDGIRKQTKGWEISPSGQMVNITAGDGVVIDEGLPVTESAFVKTEPPPMPGLPPPRQSPALRQPPAPPAPGEAKAPERERKSTLDLFNDEMAVMERPIEGDVEYVDEAPRPSRMRGVAMFAGIVVVMGLVGGLALSKRRHATVETAAQAAQPAASPGAAAPATLAATAPAAGAPAPAPAAAADTETEEAAAAPAASSRGSWDKVKAKAGGKHSRSSAKSSHHRSSKRTVAAKRSSSRHH